MSSENDQMRRWWYSYLDRLKNYVPDRLFAESVLPRVSVGDNGTYEDVSLALSAAGYPPGKPTYRVSHRYGFFIPLRAPFVENRNLRSIITTVTNYYEVSPLSSNEQNVLVRKLPDEYQYLVKELDIHNNVEVTRIKHIRGDAFRCDNDGVRWIFYSYVKSNDRLPLRNDRKFYIYLDAKSYPRFFTAEIRASSNSLEMHCKDILKKLFYRLTLKVNSDIYVGVYALDVSAKLRGRFCYRSQNSGSSTSNSGSDYCCYVLSNSDNENGCVDINTGSHTCRIYNYNFAKILTKKEQDNVKPIVVGYLIRNTRYLNVEFGHSLEERVRDLLNDIRNAQSTSASDPSYAELSINTVLVNILRHVLSRDLVIEYYLTLLGFVKLEEFVNLAFLYYDLQREDGLHRLLNAETDDVADGLIDFIRNFIDNLRDNRVLILRYLLTRLRRKGLLEKLHIYERRGSQSLNRGTSENAATYWDKVHERFKNILKKYESIGDGDWVLGVLVDVAKHTLSHHLIRVVSNVSGVRPDKFLEIYSEYSEYSSEEVGIVERDAGGIGVLNVGDDNKLNIWENDKEAVEDLVLSLGKCLVGVPEDIIHFALVRKWNELARNWDNDVELRRVFKSVADELGIFLTPDELEETIKHWRSIYDEANKLAEIVNQNNTNKSSPLTILSEVHDLRYVFERRYRRFPDFNELVVFTILNIKKYPYLRTLILTLFRRTLVSRGIANRIEQLFRGSNSSDPYDRFIGEIRDSLYNENTIITQEISRERRETRGKGEERVQGGVIDALIILRNVVSSVLTRLALLSCNSACGMCYLNTRSCGRFSSPFDQVRTLDRRVLRILASRIVRNVGKEVRPGAVLSSDGAIVELGGKEYVLRCTDHDHSLQRA